MLLFNVGYKLASIQSVQEYESQHNLYDHQQFSSAEILLQLRTGKLHPRAVVPHQRPSVDKGGEQVNEAGTEGEGNDRFIDHCIK